LLETFLVLVIALSERLSLHAGETSWPMVLGYVEEWQTLLARRQVMTPEQQLGLWGELWLMSKATDPDRLAAAWRGPEGDATDFFLDGIGVELKTSRRPHLHHVSQTQAGDPLGEREAVFLSIWAEVDPVSGSSLPELVNALLSLVSDRGQFLKQLASVGYVPMDHVHYTTRYLPLDTPLWFSAQDVPRIRSSDSGVSQIRYLATLDVDKALNSKRASRLWQHFCRVVPSLSSKDLTRT
jgi:hypothetical protein